MIFFIKYKKILIFSLIFCLICLVLFFSIIFIKTQKLLNSANFKFGELHKKVLPLQKKINHLEQLLIQNPNDRILYGLEFKESNQDIRILKNTLLSNGKTIEYYKLTKGFYAGINNVNPDFNFFPGSGFIDTHSSKLVILSAHGVLAYIDDIDKDIYFKQIKNNINNFINIDQFSKKDWYSLKDIYIQDNKIYISYTEELKKDCWNTSIIYGEFNYTYIDFKKFFSAKKCINTFDNIDEEFNAHQSGGRIINFDKNNILFSVGDYRNRFLVQDENNINGKLLKININSSKYEIISKGHRNPQGLYLDKENNFILETEHGPKGGDEINLIQIDDINDKKILNYGWPIASYGEHYGNKENKRIKERYKKYPLLKSHKNNGFIEPLKSFQPSIGISEVTKIGENNYVFGSLKDRSLYFFQIDNKKIINLERVEVHERVRDLNYSNNKIYLFLEDTATIGVISLE